MISCMCASQVCAMYGCQNARKVPPPPDMQPMRYGHGTFTPYVPSVDDIRRIIREELERAAQERKA